MLLYKSLSEERQTLFLNGATCRVTRFISIHYGPIRLAMDDDHSDFFDDLFGLLCMRKLSFNVMDDIYGLLKNWYKQKHMARSHDDFISSGFFPEAYLTATIAYRGIDAAKNQFSVSLPVSVRPTVHDCVNDSAHEPRKDVSHNKKYVSPRCLSKELPNDYYADDYVYPTPNNSPQ